MTELIKTLYPIFRRWSENGSVWIISDTHFDDSDRELMGYKITTEEHFKLIKETCFKNDTLIHLGDVGNKEYFKEIKSHKVLILGNHDHKPGFYEGYFDEIYTGPLFVADKILLSHEPIDLPFCLNIHGHDHSSWNIAENDLNLAANIAGYKPANLATIIKLGLIKDIPNIHRLAIDKQKELANEKVSQKQNSM